MLLKELMEGINKIPTDDLEVSNLLIRGKQITSVKLNDGFIELTTGNDDVNIAMLLLCLNIIKLDTIVVVPFITDYTVNDFKVTTTKSMYLSDI